MNETFGQWLKRRRAATRPRISQQEVADAAGVSQAYISLIERMAGTPEEPEVDRDKVKGIADALGASRKEALNAAGYTEPPRLRDNPLRYITDPDTAIVAEAYEGLPKPLREVVKHQILSAAEIAKRLDREEAIGGERADYVENPTQEPDH